VAENIRDRPIALRRRFSPGLPFSGEKYFSLKLFSAGLLKTLGFLKTNLFNVEIRF